MEYFLISIGEKDEDLKLDSVPEEISVRINSFADYLRNKDIQVASITCAGYPLAISVASFCSSEFSVRYTVDHRFANYQSKVAYGHSQHPVSDPCYENVYPLASDPRNETKELFDIRIQEATNDAIPRGLYILPSSTARYFSRKYNFEMTSEQGIWHFYYRDDPASENLFEIKFPRLQESYEVPQSALHHKIQNFLEESARGALNSLKSSDQAFKASIDSLYGQVRNTSKTINQLQKLFSSERSDEGDMEAEGDGSAVIGTINRDLDEISRMVQEMNSGLSEVIEPEYTEIPEKIQEGPKGSKKPKELEIKSVVPEEGSIYAITITSHSSNVEEDIDLYFEGHSSPTLLLRRIKSIKPHTSIEIKVLVPLNTLLSACSFWFVTKIGEEECSETFKYGIFKINVCKKETEEYRVDVKNNTSMTLTADLVYGSRPDQKKTITIKSMGTREVCISNLDAGDGGSGEKKFLMKYNELEASNHIQLV
ncbi:unnamed protein product [Blepharisma stoltei]|uniref:Uncharacterized protein n=1 Tax=Blepharisma stoltei TaxID=1481888 RepID=A0AAU9JW79_9CILI|nr:unnamed protein product [Blepharisma stoltei]